MPKIVSPLSVVIAFELETCCWYRCCDGVRRSVATAGSVVYEPPVLLCSDDEFADELLSSEMLDESSTKSLVGEIRPPAPTPATTALTYNDVSSSSPFVVGGPLVVATGVPLCSRCDCSTSLPVVVVVAVPFRSVTTSIPAPAAGAVPVLPAPNDDTAGDDGDGTVLTTVAEPPVTSASAPPVPPGAILLPVLPLLPLLLPVVIGATTQPALLLGVVVVATVW
uniref:Uncharacterized protein n=1 Tax=Anopheles culicifacies TaxID=139723 RepID=A0A182LSM5_9DIPT